MFKTIYLDRKSTTLLLGKANQNNKTGVVNVRQKPHFKVKVLGPRSFLSTAEFGIDLDFHLTMNGWYYTSVSITL